MPQTVERIFIDCASKKLEQLLSRIQACIGKLSPDEIWARGHENENAIGNLVLHLAGNVRQWIVSGVGGAPDTRVRDTEFDSRGGIATEDLLERIQSAVREAIAELGRVSLERMTERVQIQKYDVTITEAIFHVVEHFSQHTGQIIYATKMLTGEDLGFYKHLRAATHSQTTP